MKQLTVEQVLQWEAESLASGQTFASVVIDTPVKTNKTGRTSGVPLPFRGLHKIAWGVFSIGREYENAVKNRLISEGKVEEAASFTTEKASGMTFVENPHTGERSRIVLVSDKDPNQYYIRLTVLDNPKHKTGTLILDADGREVKHADILDWLPPVSSSSGKQQTDVAIKVRSVKIENVRSIKAGENNFIGLPASI